MIGSATAAQATAVERTAPAAGRPPREVWVASLCQHNLNAESPEEMSLKILKRMEEVLPMQPDIIFLPETFHTANLKKESRPKIALASEQAIGAISQPFAQFAKQHRCNVTSESRRSLRERFV